MGIDTIGNHQNHLPLTTFPSSCQPFAKLCWMEVSKCSCYSVMDPAIEMSSFCSRILVCDITKLTLNCPNLSERVINFHNFFFKFTSFA
jgi:hypothetical protein